MGRLDGFIKENPKTYKLYKSTRKLLEPYTSENLMEALRIEYLTTECGEYFSELALCAEEEHFLNVFTPEEMTIMMFWINICPTNNFGDLDSDIERLCNEYCKLTGNQVPNPTGIPDSGL